MEEERRKSTGNRMLTKARNVAQYNECTNRQLYTVVQTRPQAADLAGQQPRFGLSRLADRENCGLAASRLRKIIG